MDMLTTLLELVGLAVLCVGLALMWPPLGVAAAGASLVLVGAMAGGR